MNWLLLGVFLASAGVTILATPLVAAVAKQLGLVDSPGGRRVHTRPVPRVGGVAVLLGLGMAAVSYQLLIPGEGLPALFMGGEILPFLLPALLVALVGLVDDIRGLSPGPRVAIEAAAAVVLIDAGFVIDRIATPWGTPIELTFLAYPVTLLWFIGITNAFNLIDGLDGLLCSVALTSLLGIGVVALMGDRTASAVLSFSLAGAILGFLPWNWHQAKIFLGDTGSLLIGFCIAALSIKVSRNPGPNPSLAMHVPILLTALPITETVFTLARRYVSGQPYMTGDKSHIHHVLLNKGLSVPKAVLSLATAAAAFSGMAILSRSWRSSGVMLSIGALAATAIFALRWLGYAESTVLWHRLRTALSLTRRPALPTAVKLARLASRIRECQSHEAIRDEIRQGLGDTPGIALVALVPPGEVTLTAGHFTGGLSSAKPPQSASAFFSVVFPARERGPCEVSWAILIPQSGPPKATLMVSQVFSASDDGFRLEDILRFLAGPLEEAISRIPTASIR